MISKNSKKRLYLSEDAAVFVFFVKQKKIVVHKISYLCASKINIKYLNSFLHTIRALYHSRATHALKSVILVGVKNITGVMQGAVSPFNINEELEVPYFTNDEILELLAMHETATTALGKPQLFSAKVKERVCYMTAGQPGLVNGFAGSLVQLFPNVPVFEFEP